MSLAAVQELVELKRAQLHTLVDRIVDAGNAKALGTVESLLRGVAGELSSAETEAAVRVLAAGQEVLGILRVLQGATETNRPPRRRPRK